MVSVAGSWSSLGTADIAGIGAEQAIISVICRGLQRGQKVLLKAWASCLLAGASTNPTAVLRRGTTVAGAQVGDSVFVTAAATERREITIWNEDNAAGDDQAYVLTLSAASGTLTAATYGIQAEVVGP